MAFTVSDFEDLVRLLGEHPEWRERLRPVILGEEILQLPSRMDRVEAALVTVGERLDRLTEEVRDLTAAIRDLGLRADRTDGRLSNIEGGLLEARYDRNLGSWFSAWLRRAEKFSSNDVDSLSAAASAGRITEDELDSIRRLDLIVTGLDKADPSAGALVLAIEVSYTVNPDDVTRAHNRAKFLEKAGFRSSGFVGGYRITDEAQQLAETLNVIVDLHRPAA